MRLELTRRGSYALRAMTELARAGSGAWLAAGSIAAVTGVPRRFLPQVLGDLVHAGLVETRLGRSGGYRLAVPPGTVSVLAVIEASEGDPRRRTCVLRGIRCATDQPHCEVHQAFAEAQEALLGRLAVATLADL